MKNVMGVIVDSWFALLNGNLTIDATQVKVYQEDPENSDDFHNVQLRAESETDSSNKSTFVTNPVVIVDIITVHPVSVNSGIADDIDNQIRGLLFPTRQCALPVLNGLQISNVIPVGSTYLNHDDGTKRYYRKITRYKHRINQVTI